MPEKAGTHFKSYPLFNSVEQRRNILHYLLITAILAITISSIPDIVLQMWQSTYMILASLSLIGLCMWLNRIGKTDLAANLIFFSISVLLFIQGEQMGPEAMVSIFYLPMIIAVAFILDNKQKLLLAFHIIHPIVFVALLQLTDSRLWLHPTYTPESATFIGHVNLIAAILLCFFFVIVIIYFNSLSHTQLYSLNNKLETQNKELLKVNQELDQLVYSISHDLRSPVASALGLTDLIQSEQKETQIRYYNDLTRTCLRRLDQYIIDLLDYLKNNRMDVLPQTVVPKVEIDMIVLLNQPYHSDVKVEVVCDEELTLTTDRNRFRIILNNIISNAYRYMRPEETNKTVRLEIFKQTDGVQIKIRDNGVGISPKNKEKIFEMFYRVDDRTKGSGLGLYITKEAISRIGGTLQLESEYGKFTEFTLYFPDLKTV